jgi:hypothetical protein
MDQMKTQSSPGSNRFRSTIVMLCAVPAFLLGATSLAAGAPPTRQPNVIPTPFVITDTQGNNPCSFPVQVNVTTNKEVVTTFAQKGSATSVHISGALMVQLTNMTTGASIDRNISGPTHLTYNADGSITQIALGQQLWVFDPGVAPDLPRLVVISGRTVSLFNPGFALLSRTGAYEDICAALAT